MKFTEAQLEQAFIELLEKEAYTHVLGEAIQRAPEEVLIKEDIKSFLNRKYAVEAITKSEIESIIRDLERYPASDLYESNKAILKMICDGFLLKREDRTQKDIFIQLLDYSQPENNIYKVVNQLEITGFQPRIPDVVVYVNGLPLVLLEFKSSIREEATIYDAYVHDGWLIFDACKNIPTEIIIKFLIFNKSENRSSSNGSVFNNLRTAILKQFELRVPYRKLIENLKNRLIVLNNCIDQRARCHEALKAPKDLSLSKLATLEI